MAEEEAAETSDIRYCDTCGKKEPKLRVTAIAYACGGRCVLPVMAKMAEAGDFEVIVSGAEEEM